MNRNQRLSLAALLLLPLAPACIPDERPAPGDITFHWTMQGPGSSHIYGVHVTLVGEKRDIDADYPGSTNGDTGITLHAIPGGTYNFKLRTLDYGENCLYRKCVIYTGSGTFTVDGNIQVDAVLVAPY